MNSLHFSYCLSSPTLQNDGLVGLDRTENDSVASSMRSRIGRILIRKNLIGLKGYKSIMCDG